ncbi:MAG: cytochrome c [Verrucomicrobiota bacterium]
MKADAKTTSATSGAEPSVGFAPVPIAIFLLIGILFYVGQLYLDQYGGGFNAKVYQPYDSYDHLLALQPKGEGDAILAKGEKIFNAMQCVTCHQPTGLGIPGVNPPLAGSEWVLAEGPNRVIAIIELGLQGPVTVKGQPFSAAMPTLGRGNLSDADVAAVASFIRSNPKWGNHASVVKQEQVKAVREKIQSRSIQWTADEILALPEK